MNLIDACLLGMLAIADLGFLIHLRRRRNRAARVERVMRSLEFAIHREISTRKPLGQERELVPAG